MLGTVDRHSILRFLSVISTHHTMLISIFRPMILRHFYLGLATMGLTFIMRNLIFLV